MDAADQKIIEERIKIILADLFPGARLMKKYGGTLIETVPDNSNSQIGGYFFYKNHMSFEFSNGAYLTDHHAVLSGNGKHRRHVKIAHPHDFPEEAVRDLLLQAHERAVGTD